MKPSSLHVGDQVSYTEGAWGKASCLEFVERIPRQGCVQPATNVFRSEAVGIIMLSDSMVVHRVRPVGVKGRM